MSTPWLSPKAGRTYVRAALVCRGTFPPGRWLSRPFSESRIADPCGYIEPPGAPSFGTGYHCPRCGGALERSSVEASYVDLVEAYIEGRHADMRLTAFTSSESTTPTGLGRHA